MALSVNVIKQGPGLYPKVLKVKFMNVSCCFVQNLENFCQIFGVLSSILGIFQSTFVGILHAGNIGHIWRKESETDICQVTLDIFGQTKFDSRLKTKLCNCDSQGSLFGKHTALTA